MLQVTPENHTALQPDRDDPARLITLGNNIWAFKLELGMSYAFNSLGQQNAIVSE